MASKPVTGKGIASVIHRNTAMAKTAKLAFASKARPICFFPVSIGEGAGSAKITANIKSASKTNKIFFFDVVKLATYLSF